MKLYRLHKYDPKFYDKIRGYTKDDWTHISDIWHTRTVLTREEYLRVEDSYVTSINSILDYQGADRLQVFSDGYSVGDVEDYQKRLVDIDPSADLRFPQGQWVDRERAELFFRLCLRDLQGHALSDRKSFFVLFTGEFYVHLGCSRLPKDIFREIENNGLFLQPWGQLGDAGVDNEFYGELVQDRGSRPDPNL